MLMYHTVIQKFPTLIHYGSNKQVVVLNIESFLSYFGSHAEFQIKPF